MKLMVEIGKRLKELRSEKNITQQELADRLGCSKASLSRYETGLQEFSVGDIEVLCNYFDVNADYLLCLTDTRVSQKGYKACLESYIDSSYLSKIKEIEIDNIKDIITNKNYLISLLTDETQYNDAQDYLKILNELTICRDKLEDLLHTVDSLK